MNVFELFAKLSLDKSEYDKGLDDAEKKGKSFGSKLKSGLATAAKVGGAAITATTTALVAFGKSSVSAGADFDSSMSQVAATMGKTVDEIQNLRDFAQQMGSTTAFSATQAADALNYMALAGYDAETSMSMLPNVLNLAAAGGMELSRASDMVTDAQSALGLSLEETADLVDKMAKASSKSNTSVEQLGDAMLTIGGTAKSLSGGTTELATALGILADNGVKGAEGGTALRNVLLGIQSGKFEETFGAMGVKAYDAEGNLRSLEDVFTDMNKALDGMTDEQRTNAITSTFNKVDLKNINALLDTSVDRWNELGEAIDNSEGAASQMAETQLDNLTGDVTLFKSALEGLQIAMSDELTPSLRKFVQFGSEGLSRLTEAFKSGGLEGAVEEFGNILSDGLSMLVDKLPGLADAGLKLLGALGKGILDNLPKLLPTIIDLSLGLAKMIISSLPELITAITNALPTIIPMMVTGILDLIESIVDNIDVFADALCQLIIGIADVTVQLIPILFERLPEILMKLGAALLENLPILFGTIVDAITRIGDVLDENIETYITQPAKEWFSNLWENIKTIFTSVPTFFKNVFTKAWTNIKNVFTSWGSFFGNLWNTIADKFKAIGTKIGDAISGAVKSGINGIITAIENIINKGIGLINGAIKLINKIPGVNVGYLEDLGLPKLAKGGVVDRPTIAEIGEQGREAVVPLENNTGWIKTLAEELKSVMGSGDQPIVIENHVYLEGEADGVFRLVRQRNNVYTKMTGRNPLATP